MKSKVAPVLVSAGVLALAAPAAAVAQQTAAENAYGGAVVTQQPIVQQAPPPAVPPVVLPEVDEEVPAAPQGEAVPEEAAPAPEVVPAEEAPAVAALPFTGLELGVVSLMGLALLAAGVAGRVLVRRGVRA